MLSQYEIVKATLIEHDKRFVREAGLGLLSIDEPKKKPLKAVSLVLAIVLGALFL